MPTWELAGPSGESFQIEGSQAPTEKDIAGIVASMSGGAPAPSAEVQPQVPAGKFENARDVSAAVARGELSKDQAVKMLHANISQLQQERPDWRSAAIAGTFGLGTSAAEMAAGMATAEAAAPLAAMANVVPVIGPAVVLGSAFALGSAAAGKIGKAGRFLAEKTDIGKQTFKEIDEAQRKSPEAAMVGEFAPQAIAAVSTGQSIINAIRRAPDQIGKELGSRVAGAAIGGGVMTALSPIVQQVTEGKHDPVTMTKFWENFAMGLTMSGDAGKEKVEFERAAKIGPIAEHMFKEGFAGKDLPTKEAIEKQFQTELSQKEWEHLEQIHTSTEYIDQAAIKIGDKVHVGISHPEIIEREGLDPKVRKTNESGFITNRGRFVGREEGQTIAARANQVDAKEKGHQLWSEDLRSGRRPTTILEGLKIENKGGGVHEVSVKGKSKTVKFLTLDQAMALPEVQAKLKEFTDKQLELKKNNPNHVIKKFAYFGHVSGDKSTIFIRRNRGKTDPTFTHEMTHALEDLGIITKDQSEAVVKRFLTPEIKAEVQEFYAKEDWETEYLAHILESWHRKGNAPRIHWLERAYDFVRRIIGLESTEKYQGKKAAESVLKAGLGEAGALEAAGEGAAKFSTKGQKEGEVFARSLEAIKERIPPESRFIGAKAEGQPVLHPSGKPFLATDITSKTGSLNIDQPAIDRSIDAAVKQSGPAAELAIQKLKEDGIVLSPPSEKHWKDVENLPKKDRFWYETSAEAMAISFKNFGKMIPKIMDLIAATSPLADPNYNARLAISILSEVTQDKPSMTPAVVPTGVADALFDRFGKEEARKIGSFGQTFRFLSGLIDEAPLSTNDRQVAASFNIPDKAFGEYPVLYEVISRFYNNLRDEINKANPNSPDGPMQSWQLQALSWVQTRAGSRKTRRKKITDEAAFEGDAYAQAFKKAAKSLRDSGIPIDTDRETGLPLFTPEALKNPEVSKVLSPPSEGFAKDIFQTMEIVTNLTKTGKEFADLAQKSFELGIKGNIKVADAVIFRHMAALSERSSKGKEKEGEEKVLEAALEEAQEGKKGKKKKAKSILSKLAQAFGNATADIARIEYGKGTFQGQLSHNLRIPLSEVPLEAREAFLSILGEHYSQAAQAASSFIPAENNEAHDTYSVFLRGTNDLNIPEIKEFAETLSKNGHEANITSRPNGLILDIHPTFKESGPSPIRQNLLKALVLESFLKYDPKISGSKYDSMYIERPDYKNKTEQFKRKLLNEATDSISEITGLAKKVARNLAEGKSESGSDPLQGLSVANAKRAGRIRDTYQKRLSDIEAVRKQLKAKAKEFEADMKKTLPVMQERIARQEKRNENARLKEEASKPKFSVRSRDEIYAEHGYTEDDIAEWRGARKEAIAGRDTAGRKARVPQVQEAAIKYYNREITQDEYNATVRLHMPIVPITKETFPEFPTDRDVISSLTPAQVEKGIVGLNLEIPEGKYVGSRLDINAYQNFDTWNVSLHDKDQTAIGYGKTAVLNDVKFETSPERAQKIAMGQAKSTFAKMFGNWQNMHPEDVYELAHKLIDDPNWVQVGMNPFRHSWFYDKADGRPLESAKQVIQVGPLVLASKQGIKYMEGLPKFSVASEKGYKEEAIHGTVKDFTEFKPSVQGRLGGGIYVARRGDEAASIKFAKRAGLMAAVRGEKASDPRVINLRADFGRTLNMDDLTQNDLDSLSKSIPQNASALKYLGITPENAEASNKMLQSIHEGLREGNFNPADLQEAVGENEEGVSAVEKIYNRAGFDSISKAGKYGVEPYTETVVFDPSRLKLADPVTYDDEGVPIPDAKRYDKSSRDIRFSAGEEPAEKPKEDPAKVKRIINRAVGLTDTIKHRETPVNVGYNIGLATGREEAEKAKQKAFESGRKVGVEQGKNAPAEQTVKQRIKQMAETQKTEAYHEARPLVEELQERLNGSVNSLDALQAVLKAQERATQKGKAIGEKEAKDNLSVAQDWLTAESRGLFTDITNYLKAALPKEYHSMFMNRINNAVIVPNLMTGNPKSMFHKVAAVAELIEIKSKEVHRQNLVSAINDAYVKALSSPSVDVGMKARMRALLEPYGMGSMSPKRRARLEETRKYVEKMDAQGLPHGVPENVMDDLELLNKVPIKDLPVGALQAIHDDILMMDKLGRLTVKSRKNIRINRANFALQDLATQKTNKWEDKEGIKAPSFGDLTGVQKIRNKITSLQNRMAFMDRVLLPVDAMMDWMDGGKATYNGFLFKHIRNPLDRSFNLGLAMKSEIMEPLREMQKKYNLTTEDAQKIGVHAITMMEDGHDRLLASGIPDADIALARRDYQNRKDYQEVYNHMRQTLDRLLPSVQKLMKEEYNLEVKPVDFYFPFLRDFSKYQPKLQESERYTKLSEVDQSGLKGFMDGLQDDYTSRLTNETQKKFTIERKKNAATPIKYNAFDIFTQHINDVTHFLASQAELKHINRLVESDVFKDKYGSTGQRMMAGWLDTYARQGRVNPDQKIKWLDWLRRNSGAGMLAFRVVSQFKHLSNVPLAVQRAGSKNYWSAMNDVVTGKADSFLKEHFPETYERGGGEIGIAEAAQQSNKTLKKASELGFLVEKKIDQINAQACALGTYKRLMEEKTGAGFDYLNQPVDKEAQAKAMVLSRRAVASPSSKDVPLAISRGALTGGNISVARSLFQFSNIMLDQWSNIRHDFIGAGILEKNPQLAGAMLLAITAVIVAEDLIVTNIHDLENKILGYEPKKKESVAKSLSMEVLKRVPFANNVTSAILYGETGVPVLQLLPEFGKSAKKIGGEKTTEGVVETALTAASVMGVAGAGQAKEFYQKYRKGQNQ